MDIGELSRYYKYLVDYGIIDVIIHPFDYADTLIRLGYEPFPPIEEDNDIYPGKSLVLPGVTSYVYYIYMIDGFAGCFRPVVPYVASQLVNRHLRNYMEGQTPFSTVEPSGEPPLSVEFTNANIGYYLRTRFWKVISNIVAIQASYPFHALAVRTMARFVTVNAEGFRPTIQESWIDELGKLNSVFDLYSGCQARIIREILFGTISATSFLIMMKVVQTARSVEPYQAPIVEGSMEYLGNSIAKAYTNPFQNVSDLMIINQTDIPLGNPPFSDPYLNCFDCYVKLEPGKKWKTSSGLRKRNYFGPVDIVNGRLVPKPSQSTQFGPTYFPKDADAIPFFLKSFYAAFSGPSGGRRSSRSSIILGEFKSFLSERPPPPPQFSFYGTSPFRLEL